MKIAYLVLAHNNPGLLKKLTRTLSDENSAFFVHIDKKADLEAFSSIEAPNVFFSPKRHDVRWGEYSVVEATLTLVRMALEWPGHADYLILLSGVDYPLRSEKYIHAFLSQNQGIEFMSIVPIPCAAAGQPLSRINTLRYSSEKPVFRFLTRALGKFGLTQRDHRKYLRDLQAYSGSMWWALSREACEYILHFMEAHPHVVEFFRNTPAPDEMILHTILGNSEFARKMRRNLHFTHWPNGGPHPATLEDQHIAVFESQGKISLYDVYGSGEALFARKFSDQRLDLLQRMDALIARVDPS